VCLAILAAGCGKSGGGTLNVDRTLEVESNGSNSLTVDAPGKDQKVKVTATCTTGNFSIYAALEKDQAGIQQAIDKQVEVKGNMLGKKERTKDATLEFMVPAKNGFVVIVSNETGKTHSVQVRIVGSE
jgi:hypothetical protein